MFGADANPEVPGVGALYPEDIALAKVTCQVRVLPESFLADGIILKRITALGVEYIR